MDRRWAFPFIRKGFPVLAAAALLALGACSSGGSGSGPDGGPGGGSSLTAALGRFPGSAGNRSQITYDDTSELVRLAGSSPTASPKGFGQLRSFGAGPLASYGAVLQGDTGINLLADDYAISAGLPPATSILLAGGQDATAVTRNFTKLGWKPKDGELVTIPNAGLTGANGNAGLYSVAIPQVRVSGSDVALGGSAADLSQVGSVSGPTLASDPLISALASCLGNVIVAQIETSSLPGFYFGGKNAVAVAVGVLQPSSATATAQAVTCVAWPSSGAAGKYEKDVRQALATGVSLPTNEPFSPMLVHSSVTNVGGSQHIVRWQALTPAGAGLVLNMTMDYGLPALPDCNRMTPAEEAEVIGCH